MHVALQMLGTEPSLVFAATILLAVFFLIARVVEARQPVALAFAMMPLLITWAVQGATA
jgi:hypothetical protein